jgi:hypothetical protein
MEEVELREMMAHETESLAQHCIPLENTIVVNGYIYSLFAANQDNKVFPAGYGGIYKVSLQEGVVRCVQRDNNTGKFRSLGFMHCNCVGQDYLIQICSFVEHLSPLKIYLHAFFVAVY